MSKHTPGPWFKQQGLGHTSIFAKTLIARVYSEKYRDHDNETANAELMRSSLELLDMLRELVNDCTTTHPDHGYDICAPGGNAMSRATTLLARFPE